MDSPSARRLRASRMRDAIDLLEACGGDELAVLEGVADGLVHGLREHGRLDLDAPRDWERELDQELRDATVYRACKREADRRARERGGS